MKVIAETTGQFALMDFVGTQANDIPYGRPAVVTKTSFYVQRLGLDQIRILGEVPDDFTDEALLKALGEKKTVAQILESFKKKASPKE